MTNLFLKSTMPSHFNYEAHVCSASVKAVAELGLKTEVGLDGAPVLARRPKYTNNSTHISTRNGGRDVVPEMD